MVKKSILQIVIACINCVLNYDEHNVWNRWLSQVIVTFQICRILNLYVSFALSKNPLLPITRQTLIQNT